MWTLRTECLSAPVLFVCLFFSLALLLWVLARGYRRWGGGVGEEGTVLFPSLVQRRHGLFTANNAYHVFAVRQLWGSGGLPGQEWSVARHPCASGATGRVPGDVSSSMLSYPFHNDVKITHDPQSGTWLVWTLSGVHVFRCTPRPPPIVNSTTLTEVYGMLTLSRPSLVFQFGKPLVRPTLIELITSWHPSDD